MVNNEKMNGKYEHPSPLGDLRSSAGAFASVLLELAELQGKLFRAELKSAMQQSIGSAVAIVLSLSCLLGSLPVIFLGLSSAIAYCCGIEAWSAQLLVGGSISLISVLIAAISVRKVTQVSRQFKRSADELSNNIEWTKKAFRGASSR
jgi:hypothetical protein